MPITIQCYFCHEHLDPPEARDAWCAGCNTYICADCDDECTSDEVKHLPEDHVDTTVYPEDDDE